MDLSMPALLGYFMTMLYNPNNVTIEASPFTTVAEMTTGDDLCRMFGYNVEPNNTDLPLAWGHIVCGGSVANLESVRYLSMPLALLQQCILIDQIYLKSTVVDCRTMPSLYVSRESMKRPAKLRNSRCGSHEISSSIRSQSDPP